MYRDTAPTNARARHHPQRLILRVQATPELTAHVQDNASLLRNQVNLVLEKHKSKAGIPLRINSVDTTASGNVVVVAADKLTSADLVEHSEAIASAILPDSSLYIKGERDKRLGIKCLSMVSQLECMTLTVCPLGWRSLQT